MRFRKRFRKSLILTVVFVLSAMYFSTVSFGGTDVYADAVSFGPGAPRGSGRPVTDVYAVAVSSESADLGRATGFADGGASCASWQDGWSKELDDLVYRSGLRLGAGDTLSLVIPEEAVDGAEQFVVAVFDLDSEREVDRMVDCAAGDSFFWKAEKDGRYYVAALVTGGEESWCISLNDYVLTEVSEPGGHSGGVIPLAGNR